MAIVILNKISFFVKLYYCMYLCNYYFNILDLSFFKNYIHSFTYAMHPEEFCCDGYTLNET